MAIRRVIEYVQRYVDGGASSGFRGLAKAADEAQASTAAFDKTLKKTGTTAEETSQGLKAMLGPFGQMIDDTRDATVAFGPFAGAGVAAFAGIGIEVAAVTALVGGVVVGIYELVQGADELLERSAEFEARGLGISADESSKISEAAAATDSMWAAMDRLQITLATEVAPAVEQVATAISGMLLFIKDTRDAMEPYVKIIRAARQAMLELLPGFKLAATVIGYLQGGTAAWVEELEELEAVEESIRPERERDIEALKEYREGQAAIARALRERTDATENLVVAEKRLKTSGPETVRFSGGVSGVEQDFSIQEDDAAFAAAMGRGGGIPGGAGVDPMAMLGAASSGSADQLVSIVGNAIAPGVGTAVVMLSNLAENIDGLEAGLHDMIDGIMALPEAIDKIPEIIKGLIARLPELIVTWITEIQPAMRELAVWLTIQLPIELIKIIPQLVKAFWDAGIDMLKDLFASIGDFLESPFKGKEGKFLGTSFKRGNASILGMDIPGLAQGGIATRPTLAQIGEGGEPEAVIPLSKLRNMMPSGGSGGANITINGNFMGNADALRDLTDAIRRTLAADGLGERGLT